MKIEMGESACYSWLRHIKGCQIVQTNWKASPNWEIHHEEELEGITKAAIKLFSEKYGYELFKKSKNLAQIIAQAECDVIGIDLQHKGQLYAIDVAFHGGGLNYGDKIETATKILAKSLRTAMCIYGFLDTKKAEIIFCSPKINKNVLNVIDPCLPDLQQLTDSMGMEFKYTVIANEDFQDQILTPLLQVSESVADTNELFLRSYQLSQIFGGTDKESVKQTESDIEKEPIGRYAERVFLMALEENRIPDEELRLLQTKEYSAQTLKLSYPAFVRADTDFDRRRYLTSRPVQLEGIEYFVCSQWMENAKQRLYIEKWEAAHQR